MKLRYILISIVLAIISEIMLSFFGVIKPIAVYVAFISVLFFIAIFNSWSKRKCKSYKYTGEIHISISGLLALYSMAFVFGYRGEKSKIVVILLCVLFFVGFLGMFLFGYKYNSKK